MKISNMPKQFAAELLLFLAEHEEFDCVAQLGDAVETEEIRALLREISSGLMEEIQQELKTKKVTAKDHAYISKQAKAVLANLSPHEENSLLEIFGVTEKS
ncbi:MAG: hypothetical protein ABH859_06265 [Pseudomonadota bacterium]